MNENQFDKSLSENPQLSFLVITDSFQTELGINERGLRHWIKLQGYSLSQVTFTPTYSKNLQKFITQHGGKLTTYKKDEEGYVLKSGNSIYLGSFNTQEIPKNHPFNSDRIMRAIVRCSLFDSDWIVIDKFEERTLPISKSQNKYINSETGRELIRVLAVNLHKFDITPMYKLDEAFYNIYRFKSVFYEYQLPWSVVVMSKIIMDRQQQILHGLSQRLQFSCTTMDYLEHAALRKPINSTRDRVLYYLTYLIVLITGSFDSLAWLCNEIYDLKFHQSKIVLKDHKENKFLKAIQAKNQNLGDYLLKKSTQEKISLFYPMRDSFVHREFLKGSRITGVGFNGNGYQILPETKAQLEALPRFNSYHWGILDGFRGEYVDGYRFARALFNEFVELINSILCKMNWELEAKQRTLENPDQIIEHAKLAKTELWKFLKIPEEPMYF